MRVIHILDELDPLSGISAAVQGLSAAQNAAGGGSAEILTAADARFADLATAFADFDIVHVHSCWTRAVHAAAAAALAADKVLVMQPHACLDPVRLRHHAFRKRLVGRFYERRLLPRADLLVATCEAEKGWIRSYIAPAVPRHLAVVPLGVESRPDRPFAAHRPRTLLYIGRLAPLKGLDLLCSAWKLTPHPNWRLVISGPDAEGTQGHLVRLLAATNAAREPVPSVTFLPPVVGEEKWRLIESADALVLPSLSENYGLTVAEALAEGVPVLTTTATPWAAIDGACGIVVPPTIAGLANGLSRLFALPVRSVAGDSLERFGTAGRAYARAHCSWAAAVEALGVAYRLAYAEHK